MIRAECMGNCFALAAAHVLIAHGKLPPGLEVSRRLDHPVSDPLPNFALPICAQTSTKDFFPNVAPIKLARKPPFPLCDTREPLGEEGKLAWNQRF